MSIVKEYTSTAIIPGGSLNHPAYIDYKKWVENDLHKSVYDVETLNISMDMDQIAKPGEQWLTSVRHDNKTTWTATFKDGSVVTRVVEA